MAQGTLGVAGVRRLWAGAGLQHGAYRGGGILRGFPHSLLLLLLLLFNPRYQGSRGVWKKIIITIIKVQA